MNPVPKMPFVFVFYACYKSDSQSFNPNKISHSIKNMIVKVFNIIIHLKGAEKKQIMSRTLPL